MAGRKPKTNEQRAKEAGISLSTWKRRQQAAGTTATGGGLRDEKLKQEIRRLEAQAEKEERYLEMLEYDYLPRAVVEQQQAAIAHVCNALVRAAASELPALLEGMKSADMEKRIKKWSIGWSDRLAGAQSDVWKEAEADVRRSGLKGDLKRVATAKEKRGE